MFGILAGIMIAIGCVCNATIGGVAGAVLFAVGLLTICIFELKLFTGQVWRLRDQSIRVQDLAAIWIENLIGVAAIALITLLLPQREQIIQYAAKVSQSRIYDTVLLTFLINVFLGVPCGVLMTFAVKSKDDLCIILCVSCFILCGFRHCIADMYYLLMGAQNWSAIVALLGVSVGNILGGNLYQGTKQKMK